MQKGWVCCGGLDAAEGEGLRVQARRDEGAEGGERCGE